MHTRTATALAALAPGPWVELEWQSPSIPPKTSLEAEVSLFQGGTQYTSACPVTYRDDGTYAQDGCTPSPADG